MSPTSVCAAHVKRYEMVLAEDTGCILATGYSARWSREDCARREAYRVRQGRHSTMRLHHQELAHECAFKQTLLQDAGRYAG